MSARLLTAVSLTLCLLACSPAEPTSIRVRLTYDDAWGLDGLSIAAEERAERIALRAELRVLIPDDWFGREIELRVSGLRDDVSVARGAVVVVPEKGKTIDAAVTLELIPCGAWCAAGETKCDGDGVATCVAVAAGCLAWSAPVACEGGESCSLGACRDVCIDECADGESRCEGPTSVTGCGQADSDSCLDWTAAITCPGEETCSNGTCASSCADECADASTQCLGAGTVTCGDRDLDGCTEWGPIAACGSGQSCSGGVCASTCIDECSGDACNGASYSDCGEFDGDPCKDLSPGTSCASGDPCLTGTCATTGCTTTPVTCASPPASACIDADTLRTWAPAGTCTASGCGYDYTDADCPSCPSCTADACAGVTCTTPPPPVCVGTSLRTFASTGTCTGGACAYASTDAPCASGCTAGACDAPDWLAVESGDLHGCGFRGDGSLVCWGVDNHDQASPPAGTFTAVSAGGDHSCAIAADGAARCWGSDDDGQASPPVGSFATVSAGLYHSCGVLGDGSLACWGWNLYGQSTPPAGSFTEVTTGARFSCALRQAGTLACWGSSLWNATSAPSGNFTAVTSGSRHSCALALDGSIACWGDDGDGQATPPAGTFTAVSAGLAFTCALDAGGAVSCWGEDNFGQASPPAGTFAAVSAGGYHACALDLGGSMVCWGAAAGSSFPPP